MVEKQKIGNIIVDKWTDRRSEPVYKEPRIEPIKKSKYFIKLIAFLDILGIKDLIDRYNTGENEHKAIEKIEQMRSIALGISEELLKEKDSYFLNLSDSFVFICNPDILDQLLKILANIQMQIISECHHLLRGAVTIGKAVEQEYGKYIIGPAYIKAYLLQERNAIYPRIIFDNNTLTEIKKNKKMLKYVHIDKDKEYFLDYIRLYKDERKEKWEDIKLLLDNNRVLNYIRDEYKIYNKKENHKRKQKYGWTIQYFNKLGVWENGK